MDKDVNSEMFLSFYGDDFTGSTDVMESLSLNGLPAALFLRPPSHSEVMNFELKNKAFAPQGKLIAFGVAGVSRSMSPAQMQKALPEIFHEISKVPVSFFHYKICSTFDSSPETGNIGEAVEIALKYFPSDYIPLLVGAPALNRFCTFGNLFARVDGIAYRLDRHPTMSRHPVTPMNESDLRLHLGKQTNRKVNLLDVLTLDGPYEDSLALLQKISSLQTPEFLLFDVLHQAHLQKTGRLLLENRAKKAQLLVGSSGVEYALASSLQENKKIKKSEGIPVVGKAKKLIVMAGSCSPVTQRQINWAIDKGFAGLRINSELLADPEKHKDEIERIVTLAAAYLKENNVVLYTALGPDDPMIANTRQQLKKLFPEVGGSNDYLAKLQGVILKRILEAHSDARVVVAGGDTSGHVSLALEIWALEMLMPIAPGAPLCLAHSNNPLFDGLQIALKGGQNGNEKYFESILYGERLE